jgi:hypothetical protein
MWKQMDRQYDLPPRIATPTQQSQQSQKQKRRTELPCGTQVFYLIGWAIYRGA